MGPKENWFSVWTGLGVRKNEAGTACASFFWAFPGFLFLA